MMCSSGRTQVHRLGLWGQTHSPVYFHLKCICVYVCIMAIYSCLKCFHLICSLPPRAQKEPLNWADWVFVFRAVYNHWNCEYCHNQQLLKQQRLSGDGSLESSGHWCCHHLSLYRKIVWNEVSDSIIEIKSRFDKSSASSPAGLPAHLTEDTVSLVLAWS